MKKELTILCLLVFFVSCSSGLVDETGSAQENLTLTVLQVATTSDLDSYDRANTFCDYIFFHETQQKVLVDYNFFPAGTDICQQPWPMICYRSA